MTPADPFAPVLGTLRGPVLCRERRQLQAVVTADMLPANVCRGDDFDERWRLPTQELATSLGPVSVRLACYRGPFLAFAAMVEGSLAVNRVAVGVKLGVRLNTHDGELHLPDKPVRHPASGPAYFRADSRPGFRVTLAAQPSEAACKKLAAELTRVLTQWKAELSPHDYAQAEQVALANDAYALRRYLKEAAENGEHIDLADELQEELAAMVWQLRLMAGANRAAPLSR